MIYLHKILPLLLSPLVIFVTIGLFSLWFNKRKTGLVSLLLLWVFSLPVLSDWLWLKLEGDTLLTSVEVAPKSDAIVVLSGMARTVRSSEGYQREWGEGSDRFWAGIALFKAGRANQLVLTGGKMPWSASEQTEGEWLRDQAISQGIPEGSIFVSSDVSNTSEEALQLSKRFKGSKILLVTSAFHMPRASALFSQYDFKVIPFPVDFQVGERNTTLMDFIPSTGALWFTFRAFREWLGRLYYSLKR